MLQIETLISVPQRKIRCKSFLVLNIPKRACWTIITNEFDGWSNCLILVFSKIISKVSDFAKIVNPAKPQHITRKIVIVKIIESDHNNKNRNKNK